jgi:hypothetical protein
MVSADEHRRRQPAARACNFRRGRADRAPAACVAHGVIGVVSQLTQQPDAIAGHSVSRQLLLDRGFLAWQLTV